MGLAGTAYTDQTDWLKYDENSFAVSHSQWHRYMTVSVAFREFHSNVRMVQQAMQTDIMQVNIPQRASEMMLKHESF